MATIKVYYGTRLYSNRVIGETLPEPRYTFNNINFILGNGITTYQVLNNIDSEDSPSYVVVEDTASFDKATESPIKTEWFVVASNKERNKQLTLSLKRDFLDELWDKLKNQPFICQKSATIPNAISDAKYRKTMNLSQVKTNEYLLREDDDTSGLGWIVIYFAKAAPSGSSDDVWNTTITTGQQKYSITLQKNHISCYDSSCDILAIPLGGKLQIGSNNNWPVLISNITQILELTYGLSEHFGSWIYDLQYVPYVSIKRSTTSGNSPIPIKISDNVVDYAFWLSTAYFTKYIRNNAFSNKTLPTGNLEQRRFNEENMFRLCSPNFSSSFEFSPVKNGSFPDFIVHGILKPYSPYVYVEPDFDNLYGSTFDDGRGVVLTGDFSLDQISSAWTNYKLQNKNYQVMFDRQIQTVDLNNRVADEESGWNKGKAWTGAVAGVASGAVSGAVIGGLTGGPAGAIIGGVAGGVASGVGGAVDIAHTYVQEKNNKAIRDDARQAAIDNFQYQIGNIQAIPNTLTKVSGLTQDFKIFPIVEEYKCTFQESINLGNSIRYNGIDINLMASLSNFTTGFVKGSIVQFPKDIKINDAQAQAINSELQYGVFIKEV